LKINETIPISKEGGISINGKSLVLEEGDFLPEAGDVCVFFVSAQKDGTLLLPGKSFTVKVTELAAKQSPAFVQQAQQAEIESIEASPIYQQMVEACENEISFDRQRYTAAPELLEPTTTEVATQAAEQ
jgi:hypothetical protein